MNPRTPLRAIALSLVCATMSFAQDDAAAKKEPLPERLEKIGTLEDAISDRKFERDEEAIKLIDELVQVLDDMHDKTKKEFVKTLGRAFSVKQRKPQNASLYTAAAMGLGLAGGADAARILQKAYTGNKFDDREEWASLQDKLLEAIGHTKDEKSVKFLLDEAQRSIHDGVKKAAGRALRHYEGSSFKVRSDIVGELTKAFSRVHDGAQDENHPQSDNHERTLRAISQPWKETLKALTGEHEGIETAPDWTRWWNKHKNSPKQWKNQSDGK